MKSIYFKLSDKRFSSDTLEKYYSLFKKNKIEMWYYNHIVEYSPKKTYLKIELTLMNDRVVNIGFFNQ